MAETAGPQCTNDVAQAEADLTEHGVCILRDALAPALLTEVRTALNRAAESDRSRGWQQAYAYGKDDHVNQRVWNLPSRDPVFCDLAEHETAMHFLEKFVGWPALLSSMSANITFGGGESMILHADQGYMPGPWTRPHGINVAWCIDDFTRENGATQFVAGSHKLNRNQRADDNVVERVPAEAPAGSMIVMDGRLWHTNGVNTIGTPRAGIFTWYTLPIYLPQENWFRSLTPAVQQFGSERLLTLLGFRPQVMGRVNGLDRVERR